MFPAHNMNYDSIFEPVDRPIAGDRVAMGKKLLKKQLTKIADGTTILPEGVKFVQAEEGSNGYIDTWLFSITGPRGTPYEGGIFFVQVDFPNTFPFVTPTVKLKTKIFSFHAMEDNPNPKHFCTPRGQSCNRVSVILDILMAMLFKAPEQFLFEAEAPGGTPGESCFLAYNSIRYDMYLNDRDIYNRMAMEWAGLYASGKLVEQRSMYKVLFFLLLLLFFFMLLLLLLLL